MWGGLARARDVTGGKWSTNELPVPVCAIPDPSDVNWRANCPAPPGYVTTLPSTVPGMLAHLEKTGGPNGPLGYQVRTGIATGARRPGPCVPPGYLGRAPSWRSSHVLRSRP